MTLLTPTEKVCEELFLAYTLQYARAGKLILYAPSQREEVIAGYDAALLAGNCRELILQFKRAYSNSDNLYFDITDSSTHQRDILQRSYPPNSAFYIAASFDSLQDLFAAQADQLTVSGFLDRYIAVPAHVLIDGKRVCFTKRDNFARSYYLKHDDEKIDLEHDERLTGSEVLKRFLHPKKFEAGGRLEVDKSTNGEIKINSHNKEGSISL